MHSLSFGRLEIKIDPESTICTFESIDLDLHAYKNYDHKDLGHWCRLILTNHNYTTS